MFIILVSPVLNDTQNYSDDVEVPDSTITSVSRLNLTKLSTISHYARQSQQGSEQNSTSSRRCVCNLGVCKCCTGYFMDLINQKACMKVTYHPGDFAFDVAMSMNDRILYENSISGEYVNDEKYLLCLIIKLLP